MDKNVYKSDKKLADRGWSAMQELLDREMPTERRRRPFRVFWLFGLLLGLAGLFAWLTWPAERKPAAPAPSQPIAGVQQEELTESQKDKAQLSTLQNPTKSTQTEDESGKPVQPYVPNAGNSGKPAVDLSQKSSPVASLISSPDQPIHSLSSITIPPSENNTELKPGAPVEPTALIPVDALPLNAIPASVQSMSAAMPALAASVKLPEDMKNAGDRPVQPIKPVRRNTWSFGASTSLLTGLDLQYSGVKLGLTADWQPANNWGLRGGLAYQFQVLQEDQRSILEINAGSYEEITGDQLDLSSTPTTGNTDPLASAAIPVYVPVARLHRLEIPVQVFWQPLKRWRLYGGLGLGMNLYAQSGNQSLLNNTVLTIQPGAAAHNLNQEISSKLRDWDMRWNFGLGYKPNRRFEFGLFLNNPLRFQNSQKDALFIYDPNFKQASYGAQVTNSRPTAVGNHALLQFSASVFF